MLIMVKAQEYNCFFFKGYIFRFEGTQVHSRLNTVGKSRMVETNKISSFREIELVKI